MKKLLSVILSITMLATFIPSVFADEVSEATSEGTIKVGINAEFPPFEYYEDGKLTGFDIDLMNYIGERINYDIEYVDIPFDSLIPAVLSGRIDCAISAITVTEERDSIIDYSRAYLRTNIIRFENGQKSVKSGEEYAIVFRDGLSHSPYNDIQTLTDDEVLYIMIDKALSDLSQDRTVMKLIEKYELNKHLDEEAEYNVEYNDIRGDGSPAAKPSDEEPKTSATSVKASEWAEYSIKKAQELNIINYGGNYNFPGAITREGFCELIYNLVTVTKGEITAPVTDSFTDTKNDKILMLNGWDIINGKSATEFAPEDYLTREEAATIIIRMINKFMPMPVTEKRFEYEDIGEISEWASDAIQIISNLGFMNGVGNNKFEPKAVYTTEQAIATLVRVYQVAETSGIIDNNTDVIGGADAPTQITVIETIKIDNFYTDEAIRLINEAAELAADKEFISHYTASEEIADKVVAIGTVDYSKPTEIYYMAANREQIINNIKALTNEELDGIDIEKLLKLNKVDFSVVGNLINASYGVENLAALTILTISRGYIMPKDFTDDFALYLQYDGEYSALVSFSGFGDGVIKATMSFVKNGDGDNIFSRIYEITQGLGEDSIDVARVKY